MSKKEDLYLSVLNLCIEKDLSGLMEKDVYQLGKEKGFLSDKEYKEIAENKPGNKISDKANEKKKKLDYLYYQSTTNIGMTVSKKRILNIESYFRYLEHKELEESIKTANSAKKLSIIAILVSVLLAFVSIIISSLITTKVTIKESQIQEVLNSITENLNTPTTYSK